MKQKNPEIVEPNRKLFYLTVIGKMIFQDALLKKKPLFTCNYCAS